MTNAKHSVYDTVYQVIGMNVILCADLCTACNGHDVGRIRLS